MVMVLTMLLCHFLIFITCHNVDRRKKWRLSASVPVMGSHNYALLARLMGRYCLQAVVSRRLSSSLTLPAGGRAGRRARGRSARRQPRARGLSGGRHCTAGQSWGDTLFYIVVNKKSSTRFLAYPKVVVI